MLKYLKECEFSSRAGGHKHDKQDLLNGVDIADFFLWMDGMVKVVLREAREELLANSLASSTE